ncbi:hypothetical protein ACLMJK_003891 [Lecanora helva]
MSPEASKNTVDIAHLTNTVFTSTFAATYNDRTGGCNIQLAHHLIDAITPYLPPLPPCSPTKTPNPASTPPSTSPPAPPTPTLRILDSASGPLILTTACASSPTLLAYPHLHITATDISPTFIAHNKSTISSHPHWNNPSPSTTNKKITVNALQMDAQALTLPENEFDLAFASLALFAYPDPVKGVRELQRVLKKGGVAAVTTWRDVGWMKGFREVEGRLREGRERTRWGFLEEWSPRGKLAGVLEEGGLREVGEREVGGEAMWLVLRLLCFPLFLFLKGGHFLGMGDGYADDRAFSRESEEVAAKWVSETLKAMVGESWNEEEKEGMRGAFEEVLKGGEEMGVVRKDGKVGFEMRAWLGVGRKL